MEPPAARTNRELTALAVLPNRDLARQLQAALEQTLAIHILAELKSYPPPQTFEIRIRQLHPDLVFLDVSGDFQRPIELIQLAARVHPPVYVIAIDSHNDSDAILRSMRAGAREFLFAPFAGEAQREALERIQRLCRSEPAREPARGKLLVFSSAKPGSGASTLASQIAFALARLKHGRVLLADLDLWGGTLAFFLKLRSRSSVVDALRQMERMEEGLWARTVVSKEGIDVLPSPELPGVRPPELSRLRDLLAFTQGTYDWVIVDSPTVFEKLSLLALSESDRAYLVTTAELPSLHLTRKAAAFLLQLGFGPERFRVLVNRVGKRDGFSPEDMSRMFNAPVHATFPNDYSSLHQTLAEGRALDTRCALARSFEEFAAAAAAEFDEKQRSKVSCS